MPTEEDLKSPHFRSEKDIKPGDLVWPAQKSSGTMTDNVTLWKDQGGSFIVGRLQWNRYGLVIARFVDCDKDLGDQCLVLAGDQLGWNTTECFEKIRDNGR